MKTLDMEIALLRHAGIRVNLVVPNVSFGIARQYTEGGKIRNDTLHECDLLKLSPSGYATEFEIKVSKSDFLADFKKAHDHDSKFIKYLYYCVPVKMEGFAKENLRKGSGLIIVHERYCTQAVPAEPRKTAFKWTEKERYQLSRLGTMRILGLKRKISELKKLVNK